MKKVVLVAYSLDPRWGTEDGYANTWLEILTKYYFVDVFTDAINKEGILTKKYTNTNFHYIEDIAPWRAIGMKTGLVNIATKLFFKKVKKNLENMDLQGYSLIHCVTPAGIHSHNDLYKLGIPLVIGPLGGGLPTPAGFRDAFRGQLIKTFLRDKFYWWSLRWDLGLKKYLANANRIVLGLSLSEDVVPEQSRYKCYRIPDALVDIDYFTPGNNNHTNDKVRVLFTGRFISNKGPLLLLDAVKLCVNRGISGFVVEFAGFGLLRGRLEQKIRDDDLEGYARLIGNLSQEELLHKYQTSDIYCLPTLREPGGIAILEAMACGLPIITSNYGGPSISVTNDCGIKIDVQNYSTYVEELADALIYLMENPDLRNRMGIGGRERAVNEYSIEALNNKVIHLYESVMSESESK